MPSIERPLPLLPCVRRVCLAVSDPNPKHWAHSRRGHEWEEAEERARGARQIIDDSSVVPIKRIDMDGHGLAGAHVAQLRFFEISGDPYVVDRHHRQQCLAGLNAMAGLHGFVADDATTGAYTFV